MSSIEVCLTSPHQLNFNEITTDDLKNAEFNFINKRIDEF